MLPDCQKLQNRNVQIFGYAVHDTNGKIMEKNWRSGGISWQFEEALLDLGWEKVPNWECMFVHRKQGLFLSENVDIKNGWQKKQNLAPMWKRWWKMWILTNLPLSLTMCTWDALSVNANRMKQLLKNIRRCLNHVCLLEQLKNYQDGKSLTQRRLRGPTIWKDILKKMRWATLWTGKQETGATVQSVKSLFGWSSIQAGGTRISWRIVTSMLTICLEMLELGTNWTTWHLIISQQACQSSHKMDSGMWQTTGKADFLHSSHKRFPTMLSCGKHGTALQAGFFSRLRLCWRPWRLEINPKWCLVYFWKFYICSNELDVQETNFCLTQFYRVWGHFSGCWITYGWVTCSWSLDIVIEVLRSTNNLIQPKHTSIQVRPFIPNILDSKTKNQRENNADVWVNEWCGLRTHQHTFFPNAVKIAMRHVSRTLRFALDWLFDRINLGPKIQIKFVHIKKKLADMLTKLKLHTWWVGADPSFIECHEFLDVFLQSFSFKQQAECHVQESSGKYCWRRFGSGETETNKFDIKEPLKCQERSSGRFGWFEQPGKSRIGSELFFMQRPETDAKHQPKPNNVCSRETTPGNWDGEKNLQAQPAPGNWSEVRTSKSAGPRWNSTICKSPTINTLRKSSRKSSRNSRKGWLSQKRHQ